MKKIDLSKVKVKLHIDSDESTEVDVSKGLSQVIYKSTAEIGECAFALDLHKNPIVELTEENKRIIRQYLPMSHLAFVQIAVNAMMEEEV